METTAANPIRAAGIYISATMTTPTRPGKAPRPVWNVTAPPAYVDLMYRLGGRKYGRSYSFWTDPTEQIAAALAEGDAATSFAERKEAERERAAERADRYEGYADNARTRGQSAYDKAHAIADRIPGGQPILVGHHSEGRARRDIARIDSNMHKWLDEGKKADHFEHRAAVAGVKATGKHSVGFIQRRIEEVSAELRGFERYLDPAYRNYDGKPLLPGPERDRYERLAAEYRDRLSYWQAEMETAGGVKFGPDTIKVGDRVKTRGRWLEVTRVNAKTVSTINRNITPAWPGKTPYAEITDHEPAA